MVCFLSSNGPFAKPQLRHQLGSAIPTPPIPVPASRQPTDRPAPPRAATRPPANRSARLSQPDPPPPGTRLATKWTYLSSRYGCQSQPPNSPLSNRPSPTDPASPADPQRASAPADPRTQPASPTARRIRIRTGHASPNPSAPADLANRQARPRSRASAPAPAASTRRALRAHRPRWPARHFRARTSLGDRQALPHLHRPCQPGPVRTRRSRQPLGVSASRRPPQLTGHIRISASFVNR